jgi:hypothetical protein
MRISNSLGATDVGHFLGRKRVIFWAQFPTEPNWCDASLVAAQEGRQPSPANHRTLKFYPWLGFEALNILKYIEYTEG